MKQRVKTYVIENWKWIVALLAVTLLDQITTTIGINTGMIAERNPVWAGVSMHPFLAGSIRTILILGMVLFIATSRSDITRRWLLQAVVIGYALIPINNAVQTIVAIVQNNPVESYEPMAFTTMLLIMSFCVGFGVLCLWIWRKFRNVNS